MRKVVIGIASVAVIAVGAVGVAVTYFLDSETIAKELQKEVASRLNRELVFNGQLETKFFPKVEIVLPPTTLSYEGQSKPQFTLTGAKIGVAVLPLLKGDIQFDAVSVQGLKGVVNAKRFTQKVDKKKSEPEVAKDDKASAKDSSAFVKNLRVDSVSIMDCALTVYGLQDQKVYAVNHLNLETGEIGLKGKTSVKFSTNFEEKTQGLMGTLQLQTTAEYDINTLDVVLHDLKTIVDAKQKEQSAQLSLQAKELGYLKRDIGIEQFSAKATVDDSIEALVSADSFKTEALQSWKLNNASVNVKQGDELSAHLVGNFVGALETMSVASEDLAGAVNTVINGIKTQIPLQGKIQAIVSQESAAMTLSGKFDDQPWNMSAQLKGFTKPNINGQFQLAGITVDKWMAPSEQKKVASWRDLNPIREAVASKLERITALDVANANINLKVQKINYKKLSIDDVETTVKLKNGILNLNNMRAKVADGVVNANAQLNASQAWSITQSAQGIDVNKVLAGLELPSQLTGVANMKSQLSGIGLEEVALKKTAKGTMSAEVKNAVLKSVSLEKIATAVREKQMTGLIMSPKDETAFSAMKANIKVGNGILDIVNVTGQSAVASVNGQLKLGLLDNTLQGKAAAVLSTSVNGRKVTVPILIGGTVAEPTYGVDVTTAIKDNLTEEIKDKGRQKLEEGLGKLFNKLGK